MDGKKGGIKCTPITDTKRTVSNTRQATKRMKTK